MNSIMESVYAPEDEVQIRKSASRIVSANRVSRTSISDHNLNKTLIVTGEGAKDCEFNVLVYLMDKTSVKVGF
jgi:hypothetical protein